MDLRRERISIMTTNAGHTIPPLFGGGNDAIFIRDIGAPYFNPGNGGLPPTFLSLPTRQPGDLLVVLATQYSGNLSPIAPTAINWTSDTIGGGGASIVTRIATNNAVDDYLVPAIISVQLGVSFFCQMISLASSDPTMTVEIFQTGTQTSANLMNLPLDLIAVGTEPNNTFLIGQYLHWYNRGLTTGVPATLANAVGLNLIGEYAEPISRADTAPTTFQYFFSAWGGIFQATSAAVGSQIIPFSPTFFNGTTQTRSRYHRFRAV